MPRSSPSRVALLTAVFALVLHATVVAVKTYTHPSHSVLAVFRVGAWMPNRPAFVDREGFPLETNGFGTDGQLYLFIAHDPLARDPQIVSALDAPRYRFGRILLPALAATVCMGNSPCLPRAIIALNLAFATGIGWVAAWLVARRRGHPIWGVVLASTGSLVCATDVGNIELSAQFFGLCALALSDLDEVDGRKLVWWVAALAAVAALGRETYVLLAVGFAMAAALDGKRRRAAILASAVIPAMAWALYVRMMIPPDKGGGGLVNLSYPFGGIITQITDFLRNPHLTGHVLMGVIIGAPMLAMLARHAFALRTDRSGLALATALFGVLALFASAQVWERAGGFARGLDFVYPGCVLGALARGDRPTRYLALATLVQSVNIVADHIKTALG